MNYVTIDQLYALITLLFLVAGSTAGATIGVIKIVLYMMQNYKKK